MLKHQILAIFVAAGCGNPSHHIVLRIEGTDACGSSIWAIARRDGEPKIDNFTSVTLPFEREVAPDTRELEVNVGATYPDCPAVHCQISVDGKVVDIKTDPKRASCHWTR